MEDANWNDVVKFASPVSRGWMKGGMMMYLCSQVVHNLPKSEAPNLVIYPSRYGMWLFHHLPDSVKDQPTEVFEPETILDQRTKNSFTEYVASYIHIYTYDDDDDVKVSL